MSSGLPADPMPHSLPPMWPRCCVILWTCQYSMALRTLGGCWQPGSPGPSAGHKGVELLGRGRPSLLGNTGLLFLLWRLLWGSGKSHMAGVHSGWASLAPSFPDPTPTSLASGEGGLSLPITSLVSPSFLLFFLRLSCQPASPGSSFLPGL